MNRTKPIPAKSIKPKSKSVATYQELEKIYRQYLVPMPLEAWESVRTLEQPSLLKNVPSKTTTSSVD